MSDAFSERVRSAVVAGWWTIVIGLVWMAVAWVMYMGVLAAKPDWLITLWGGDLTWDHVQSIMLNFLAVFKLMLWAAVLVTIWATIWSRRLKRSAGGE